MVIVLEIARGLAALWVFLFHIKAYFSDSFEPLYQLAYYGYMGVPMFFVISGFVITYSAESTLNAGKSPLGFLKRRFLRIYPVFWASVIVALLLPGLMEVVSAFKTGSFQAPENLLASYSISEWVHFLLLTKVFYAEGGDLQAQFSAISAVYWSIAIEFQFYLVVCALMYTGRYFRPALTMLTLLALVNLIYPLGMPEGLFLYFWPTFALGMLLAWLFKRGYVLHKLLHGNAAYVVSFLMVSVVVWLASKNLSDELGGLAFAGLFAVLLWAISPLEAWLEGVRQRSGSVSYWMLEGGVALGAMSYSVYLLHVNLYWLSAMFVRQVVSDNRLFQGLLSVGITLLMCYVFYLFVERPFMSLRYVRMQKQVLPERRSKQPPSEEGLHEVDRTR